MDPSELVKLFFVGAFPWVSELRKLEIHFKIKDFNVSSVLNFFASLFAMGIFSYSYFVNPFQLANLPQWYWFLLSACILTLLYFSLFIFFRNSVESGKDKIVVILVFMIYIGIFCSLTTGFGLLRSYKDYDVINGQVVDEQGKGIPGVYIDLKFNDSRELNVYADSKGEFHILLKKTITPNVTSIEAKDKTGRQFTANVFGEAMVFTTLHKIIL